MNDERVFCIHRADLEAAGLLPHSARLLADPAPLLELPQHFLVRSVAERDESYKQIIPYQVFVCASRLFVFRRGGGVGEQRLAGRLSVGVGGHVNDGDGEGGSMTPAAFEAALMRERDEELDVTGPVETRFCGLINDDSDPVGRVHLGAVFACMVDEPDHVRLRDEGEDLHFEGWWAAGEVEAARKRFEKWSLLAVELVSAAPFLIRPPRFDARCRIPSNGWCWDRDVRGQGSRRPS